ncbi:MAG: anthranilate synthase component I family protein, partial [Nitrospirae bacterium]
ISRYSFIVPDPLMELRLKDKKIIITMGGRSKSIDLERGNLRPLTFLRKMLNLYRQVSLDTLPPFTGGLIGLVSYDFVNYLERLPTTVVDDLKIPDIHFFLTSRVIAFDHVNKKCYLMLSPGASEIYTRFFEDLTPVSLPDDTHHMVDPSAVYSDAVDELSMTASELNDIPDTDYPLTPKRKKVQIHHELSLKDYSDMVIRAKQYIHDGDIFQANLSQRFSATIGETEPVKLYSILRKINPSPFAFYADFGDYQIASSSPERLIRLCKGIAETRPIAGTRPRGLNAAADERLRADLLLNEKERAEHIMLIDLERNDLGKVCRYGTVEVNELMTTEFYSHVIHIVSNVRGVLAEGRDAFSLLRATFPGGTITGVPKVRCMEIIDELEKTARGPYTGSFGYISFSGEMDMNIIIRTFLIKDRTAYVQAGAGIVADSDPEREYYETIKKAEALLSTLERL